MTGGLTKKRRSALGPCSLELGLVCGGFSAFSMEQFDDSHIQSRTHIDSHLWHNRRGTGAGRAKYYDGMSGHEMINLVRWFMILAAIVLAPLWALWVGCGWVADQLERKRWASSSTRS